MAGEPGTFDDAPVLERVGQTLLLVGGIAIAIVLAFAFLAVASFVEPNYSVPHLARAVFPFLILSGVALVVGAAALVLSKVEEARARMWK